MAENFTIEANDEVENFEIDFGEVTRVSNNDFNKLENRPSYAGEVMTGETSIPEVPSAVSELTNDANYQTGAQVATAVGAETTARENADTALDNRLTTVEGIAGTALQPESINKVVMTDIAVGANTSTTTFNLEAAKENLLTGATSSKQVSMPVASSTEAGIMNSSTFDAVSNNTSNINALLNGAVAITGLPAEPTQAQLTTAWETATGATALMNRAGIYDVTNGKVWTYYTNSATWYSVTNTTQVTINTFTNNSEGTIKGSTNVGQIFAETDGTGSVNGWDALNDEVSNNTSDIADLETAVDGKQDKLIAGTNINIASDGKTISATDTTYTAGNGINISAQNVISTDAPEGFFTLPATVEGEGSEITLNNTIGTKLDEINVKGDTSQNAYTGKNLFSTQGSTNPSLVTGLNSLYLEKPDERTGQFNMVLSLPVGTYTLSYDVSKNAINTEGVRCGVYGYDSGNVLFGDVAVYDGHVEYTFNATTPVHHLYFFINNNMPDGSAVDVTNIQIEAGSTATAFEPYVGGTPSPNPDYPQDVQTVTGEQTVTVSDGVESQSYPISLGSIELCKIGDYRDYIYKSGDDWYVHKATGKMALDGTESWSNSGNWWGSGRANYGMYCYFTDLALIGAETTYNHALFCNDFSEAETGLSLRSGATEGIKQNGGTGQQYIALAIAQTRLTDVTSQALALSSLKNWLSTNKPIVYHTLVTPTDTKITDATLVGQLEALWSAMSYNGQTNFVITASDSGALPAILEVKAYQKSLNGILGAIERTNG